MNSLLETLPQLAEYKTALLALAVLCLTIPIQNFLAAPLAFVKEEQIPGVPLKGGHGQLSFRVLRTHMNSVENVPGFVLLVLIAMIAGANATAVNWLAGFYMVVRFAFWGVYYGGWGKAAGGPRTMVFVVGLLAHIVLAIVAIWALI